MTECPQIRLALLRIHLLTLAGNCQQDGRTNDEKQFYCEKQNKCISNALVCDGFLADNCGDYEDNYVDTCLNSEPSCEFI